jgi:hypothetical protein
METLYDEAKVRSFAQTQPYTSGILANMPANAEPVNGTAHEQKTDSELRDTNPVSVQAPADNAGDRREGRGETECDAKRMRLG